MASNLLNTFKKIDNHRKILIDKANAQGAGLPDSASFIDLVPHIGADKPVMLPEYASVLNTEDWVRPAEWPDCESILTNAEVKGNLYPGVIMLLDATYSDETVLPRYIVSSSSEYLFNGYNAGNVCASGYLMSDGAWYGDMTNEITHTWDTSKDIIVETGKHPGRYRWMILYYDSTKSIGYTNYTRFPAVEIIFGNIRYSGTNNYPGFFITYGYNSGDTVCKYLKNVVFLPTFNILTLSWSWGSSRYFFGGFKKLENIDVRCGTISMGTLPSTQIFRSCSRLRHLNLVNDFKYGQQFTLYDCSSLVTFKGQSNYTLLSGNLFQLEQVNNSGYSLRINGYAPENTVIIDCVLYGTGLPNYWKTQNGFTIDYNNNSNGDYSYGNFFSGNLFVTKLDFSKTIKFNVANAVPTSSPNPTINSSNACRAVIGNGSFKLKEVIWPDIISERIDTSGVVLYKHVILDLFERLTDITGNNGAYDWVAIHPSNYDELTEEELAIATNKGWEVQRGWPL